MAEIKQIRESKGFDCDKCHGSFRRKDNLKRHYIKLHGEEYVDNVHKTQCLYPGCEKLYYHKGKMLQHLEEDHGVDLKVEKLDFQSNNDFLRWKSEEETTKCVYFSKQYGNSKSNLSDVSYYMCQRDGVARSHKRHAEPRKSPRRNRKGVTKTGHFCPARIMASVSLQTGHVNVKYIKSHNHLITPKDIEHHPIPVQEREQIKIKLAMGIPSNKVYKEWREKRDALFTGSHLGDVNDDDNERHNLGMKISDADIVEEYDCWKIPSHTKNIVYLITKQNDICDFDHCFSKCLNVSCLGLCGHLYRCTCNDNSDICKHVHKIHSLIVAYRIAAEKQQTITETEAYYYPSDFVFVEQTENENEIIEGCTHIQTENIMQCENNLHHTIEGIICDNEIVTDISTVDVISSVAQLSNVQEVSEEVNDISAVSDQLNSIHQLILDGTVQELLLPRIKETLQEVVLQCQVVASTSTID